MVGGNSPHLRQKNRFEESRGPDPGGFSSLPSSLFAFHGLSSALLALRPASADRGDKVRLLIILPAGKITSRFSFVISVKNKMLIFEERRPPPLETESLLIPEESQREEGDRDGGRERERERGGESEGR